MSTSIYLAYAIGLVVGMAIGLICHLREKTQGVFRVNTTDPNKDVFRIEIGIPLGTITEYRILRLKVIDDSRE